MNDIEVIKRELPVDLLEFFVLTPLPGSEDHQKLHRAGVAMDPDLNKYDLNHLTTAHSRMSQAEWQEAYDKAWANYYTDEHIVTVIRRAAAMKANASNALFLATWFSGSIKIEHIHPLESGFLRRKFRRARRPGFPIVSPWRSIRPTTSRRLPSCSNGARCISGCGASISRSSTIPRSSSTWTSR